MQAPRLNPCASSEKPEAIASYCADAGTSILFLGAGVFVSVAVLRLANEEAGCPPDADGVFVACEGRVYGLRPSSVIAVLSTISGLVSAAFMPYAGAIVDHTPHRRLFGASMAAMAMLSMLGLAFISHLSWFYLTVICMPLGALAYNGHTLARWSYVREFVETDAELSAVVSSVKIWQMLTQLLYLALVVGISLPLGLSALDTSRLGQGTSLSVAAPLLLIAWRRFKARPASHKLERGQSLMVAGARELLRMLRTLQTTAPGMRVLLLGNAFVTAPQLSYTAIAVTFLTQQLGVAASEVGLFAAALLVSGPPGALVHRQVSLRVGHRRCMLLAICWWVVTLGCFSGVLRTPADRPLAIGFAVASGIGFGWLGPSQTSYLAALMPPGSDAELWGLVTFTQVSLAWLPSIVFASLNEALNDMRLGMASLILFFVVGAALTATIKEDSRLHASDTALTSSSASHAAPAAASSARSGTARPAAAFDAVAVASGPDKAVSGPIQ